MKYDFSGWATRNNIQCSDGRTILKDAFVDNDGQTVPLVWNHMHDAPEEVLGHALLENRDEGVYAYCKFNNTESGKTAKELVVNGDVDKLSIYANRLKSSMNNVIHGCIREVSLVLAGANPGAYIDSVIVHGDGADAEEEGTICITDEGVGLCIEHSDSSESVKSDEKEESNMNENKSDEKDKTVEEVVNSMSEEQKTVMYALIGQAVEEATGDEDEEGDEEDMKHNVFENDETEEVLAHSELLRDTVADAKKYGSMRESFLAHAEVAGIDTEKWGNMDILFPDAVNIDKEPRMIENDYSWVAKVMKDIHHSPFSRVKNTFGRMTEETARAKGYIKGDQKKSSAMQYINRVTTPTTVYIKQDLDRDDVIDITDFDVVAYQKKQLRKALDKELALAVLVGDGRDGGDRDKINEGNIRPILTDNDIYTIKYTVTKGVDYNVPGASVSQNDSKAKGVIRAAIKARKNYKGSGNPTFYTTEDQLTELLLIEDQNGRLIYDDVAKLARTLRVKEIVTVPEFEKYTNVIGIIVNLNDYTAGADKGGSVNMFDDFDIDYNQMKYLMETRMSGALTVPYSAIALLNPSPEAASIQG